MADESIVNKLGFSVEDALRELQRLDSALQTSGTAFQTFGTTINAWNTQAAGALQTMRSMATAATNLAAAMSKTGGMAAPAAQPAATSASASSQLWLPPGVQASAQQAATAMTNVGAAAQQAGQQAAQAMNQAGVATQRVAGHARGLTISWETLARVVVTQAIVRAMSQVRDALHEAVESSVEFQRRIAEIQTIAPRVGSDLKNGILGGAASFESLTRETTEFAKAFNLPLPQVTEGLYQTLSDQFTDVIDRTNVMTAAMSLAKVGVMDFQTAVTLITGTLNAYGMESGQANSVAMKFFETIRLGHVRGKELADTIGQVIPIASELGVSLNEVNAAMVALTIGGMNAHKSVTAMRGVMTAFLKPSEDMKKVVRSMGFGDPEQMIAAKGFQGALQAIADQADHMGSQIAKSVRNVRALTAELRLTTEEGAKKYNEALQAMGQSTPKMLDQILKEFRSTDSERLTAQINALKTNLTQDFGAALTGALGKLMEFAGGSDKLAAALTAMAAAAVPVVAVLGLLTIGFMAVHAAMGPLGIALLGLTALMAITAGTITYQMTAAVANIRKEADARRQATLKQIQDMEEIDRKIKESAEIAARADFGDWENRAASLRKGYFSALDELKAKNQEIVESSRQTMNALVAAQDRVVSAYRNAANASVRAVQESQQRQLSLTAQYADQVFKYQTERYEPARQVAPNMNRADQLARQAARDLANARTPEQIQAAQAEFQRADAFAKEAESIAKSTGDMRLQRFAQSAILDVMKQKIEAEKRLQQVQADQAEKLAQKAAVEQARVNDMKASMKSILADLEAFDKKGAKDPRQLQEQGTRLQASLAKFRELATQGDKVDVSTLLGFDQLQRRVQMALEGGVSQVEIQKLYSAPETFAAYREQIEKGIGPIRKVIEIAGRMDPALKKEVEGMSAEEAVNHFGRVFQQSQKRKIDFESMVRAEDTAASAVNKFAKDAQVGFDKAAALTRTLDTSIEGAMAWTDMSKQPLKPQAQRFREAAGKFFSQPNLISDKDFQELQAAYKAYIETIKPGLQAKEALEQFMRDAEAIRSGANKVQTLQTGVDASALKAIEAEQRIPDLQQALKAAEEAAKGASDSTESARNAMGQVSQIDMSGLAGGIRNAATAMWDLARASAAASSAGSVSAGGGGGGNDELASLIQQEFAASGGLIQYFDRGGRARGTDTISAMLSPGEFVVNPRSTRRFYSQLLAMNAGITPAFRPHGDSSTVTVGDININGASQPRETAREVIQAIRREFRRGTSAL